MKNSNNTIGYRTRDLPACSAVPQPTAPPRAPITTIYRTKTDCENGDDGIVLVSSLMENSGTFALVI